MISDFLPVLEFSPPRTTSPHVRSTAAPAARDSRSRATLAWSKRVIRKTALRRGPRMSLWMYCTLVYRETWLRHVRNIDYRTTHNDDACAAYEAMTIEEFADINRCQAWANWRTIPRNLSGRLPARPIAAIDLCCGIGQSTAVLACYAAPGSKILGLEYNEAFVATARLARYATLAGRRADVAFRAQSVLDDFHDADGCPVADGSIDLVNASGAVGCHFSQADGRRLARECARVLRADGLALIDTGHDGLDAGDLVELFAAQGFRVVGRAVSCPLDRRPQLCLRRGE